MPRTFPTLQAQLRAPNASAELCRALPSAVHQCQQLQQASGSSSSQLPSSLCSLWGLGNLILLMAGPCTTSLLPNGNQVCGTLGGIVYRPKQKGAITMYWLRGQAALLDEAPNVTPRYAPLCCRYML